MTPDHLVTTALGHLDAGCVILRSAHVQNLRWANSALTTNGDTRTTSMTVIALRPADGGTRVAVSSGQVADDEQAADLARACAETASTAPVTDPADLVKGPSANDFGDAPASISEAGTGAMLAAVGTFLDQPEAQFGYAELDMTTTYLATTAGTRVRHAQDAVRIESSARAAHGSTWWGTNSLQADFPSAAHATTERLGVQQTREHLDPGRHRVILTPSAVADLLIYLAWSANGRDAVEGHNVFARPGGGTRLGEKLSSRSLDLFADPGQPGLGTCDRVVVDANSSMESVFDNGLPLSRTHLITGGRLTALRASRPTAARFGLEPVYLADNLVLTDAAGHGDPAELVARTDDAVLITCLWYIREVDPQNLLLTGLTRDGVYRIRGGRIVSAVGNFRFNVSVPDVLARIVDASASTRCLPREWADWFTRTQMPALLVDGFNLSSPSEAM